MDNYKAAIDNIFMIFNEEYGSKFIVSASRQKVWRQMLKEFEPELLLAAAYHLVSIRQDWPPDIATMRKAAAYLQNGEINPPDPSEAWGRVLLKVQKQDVELTAMDRVALKKTSSIYNLRRSTNISSDRAQFMAVYKDMLRKRDEEWLTLPAVKAVAQGKTAPKLEEGGR